MLHCSRYVIPSLLQHIEITNKYIAADGLWYSYQSSAPTESESFFSAASPTPSPPLWPLLVFPSSPPPTPQHQSIDSWPLHLLEHYSCRRISSITRDHSSTMGHPIFCVTCFTGLPHAVYSIFTPLHSTYFRAPDSYKNAYASNWASLAHYIFPTMRRRKPIHNSNQPQCFSLYHIQYYLLQLFQPR